MKTLIHLIPLFFLTLAQGSLAAELKSVDIYSSFDARDYTEIDENGKKTGFEVDLAEAIFSSQGYQVRWQVKGWDQIAADLSSPSYDKNYLYIAGIEGRLGRRQNWLFASAVEFDASHYFYATKDLRLTSGTVTDSLTGRSIPNFLLDLPVNRVGGRKLRIATWKDSAFEGELKRVFPNPQHIEILGIESGDPVDWLKNDLADAVYIFASGPKNAYTREKFTLAGGPITNFDIDRFGGSSPAMPLNAFGQEMNRIWVAGFAEILRNDRFFQISLCWFGRVSWPYEFNGFMVENEAALRQRIQAFETKWNADPSKAQCGK